MDDENIKVADNIKLQQLFNTPKNDYKDIEKENANSSLDNSENNIEQNKKDMLDISQQARDSKILSINLKNNNYFEKQKNNKFKKDDNRIACFYVEEKSKENSVKLSRNSSIKEKLRESLDVDYNKLKIDLLPLSKLGNNNYKKFPKIKNKIEINPNKKNKKK